VAALPWRTLVLDSEVAIFDSQLRSRFDWLHDPDPEAVATPSGLVVFDLLYRDGRDLIQRPPLGWPPTRECRAAAADPARREARIEGVDVD